MSVFSFGFLPSISVFRHEHGEHAIFHNLIKILRMNGINYLINVNKVHMGPNKIFHQNGAYDGDEPEFASKPKNPKMLLFQTKSQSPYHSASGSLRKPKYPIHTVHTIAVKSLFNSMTYSLKQMTVAVRPSTPPRRHMVKVCHVYVQRFSTYMLAHN